MTYVAQTPLQEQWHPGGFLVSEARGHLSRDKGLITGGAKIYPGTVLGLQTVGTTAAAAAIGANTGNGTFGAITVAAGAIAGNYAVEFDDATHYVVSNPAGAEIGHANTGAVFSAGGLSFTITAGGAAFVPGDSFNVTVAAGTGKWLTCTSTATDGSQIAAGICFGLSDATLNDVSGAVVTRMCEVNASELIWDPSMSAGNITTALAQLAALGIVAR